MNEWWDRLLSRARALVPPKLWLVWEHLVLRASRATLPVLAIATLLATAMFFVTFGRAILGVNADVSVRVVDGDYLGSLPRPVDPSLFDPISNFFRAKPDYKLMAIKAIPPIVMGGGMPHPYVGPCTNCHLYVGGPGPGSQFKTPVGAMLEQLSRLHKLGPPIWPNAEMPHPPAGRCIKCHDIVVKIPIDPSPSGFRWKL